MHEDLQLFWHFKAERSAPMQPCLLLLGFCLLFPFVICGSVSLLLFLARRCHICLPCPYLERWFDVICLESQRGFAPVVSFARPSSASCSTFPEPLRWHPLPPLGSRFTGALQYHLLSSLCQSTTLLRFEYQPILHNSWVNDENRQTQTHIN